MGAVLNSEKDTLASDTTTNASFEDVDGLSLSITTENTANILITCSIQVSASEDAVGEWRLVFDSVNYHSCQRQVGSVNPGNLMLADLVVAKTAGTYTLKVQHRTNAGTLTTANACLIAVELHNGSGSVPSSKDQVVSDTVGNSWNDIAGLSTQVTLDGTSHILAILVANAYFSSNNKDSHWAINIDNTRMEEQQRDFGTANQYGCITLVTRTDSPLTAGTYTIKGEWKGAGGATLTGENFTLIAIAAECNSGADPIDIKKDVVASDTTLATSIEDIDGLSLTADLPDDAHILSFMTIDSDVSVPNTSAYHTINIDGVDHDVMERGHSSAQQHGSIGHCCRTSSVVTSPTAIVKGRWYTDSGNTLVGNDIVLTSMVLYAGTVTVFPKAFVDTIGGTDVFENLYREMGFVDAIAGVDVFENLYREMGFSDVIAGADVITQPYREMGFVDAVAGADIFTIMRLFDMADSGSGADVFTQAVIQQAKSFIDSGSGADVFDADWRALGFSDTGGGTDVFTITALKAMADSGAGADVWTLTRPMYFTDTISGADVFENLYREMGFVDAITGGDVFENLYREMGFADTISGNDVWTIPWKLVAKAMADVGGGIDVWTLTRPIYFTDSGSGTDVFTQPYREMGFEDVGAGTDVFVITYKELGFEDVGGGLDVFGVMLFRGFTDTVGGVDVWTLTRPIYFTDTGSGSDVFTTPYREMGFTDVGSGTDVFENLLRVMGFADSGTGTDVFQFIGIFDVTDTVSGIDVFTTPYREMSISDVASGADVFVTPFRAMGFIDVGAGVEVFGKSLVTGLIDKDFVDSVSGLDAFTVPFVDLAFADTGSGVDVFTNPFRAMEFIDVGSGTDAYLLVLEMAFVDTVTGIDVISGPVKLVSISEADKIDIANKVWDKILDNVLEGSAGAFLTGMASDVWEEVQADHLTVGTTGESLSDASASGDPTTIAAAVWDMVLYPDHLNDDTAGKYLYEFYKLVEAGDVYVSTSTTSEILMVRDRLGDAGVLITETVIDEEAISTDADTVFPAERLLYEVNGVWLSTDTPHAGSNYYEGANGEFDTYTGKIVLHLSLPGDNTEVLLNYTFMRGLPDNVIDQFLVEAKLYVKKYTRKDYDWNLGLGADPDEETQIALLASCSLAAMRCLEAIATGDILQFGYNFRLGDLQVESMTSGGFHVQAHIDFLKGDVERKLAMLGRSMHFVARTTKRWGRGAHGYKRHPGGTRGVY